MEYWKEIIGYPNYLISNKGRVKTKSRKVRYLHAVTKKEHFRITEERFLSVYHNKRTGYLFIQPRKDKKPKNKNIHRLVAEAFIDNPNNLKYINHIDGNKHNNVVENLEWCTNQYNHEHATRNGLKAKGENIKSSKLNEHCIYAIRYFLSKGYSHNELARIFKISRPTITLISTNKIWKHVALTGKELTLLE